MKLIESLRYMATFLEHIFVNPKGRASFKFFCDNSHGILDIDSPKPAILSSLFAMVNEAEPNEFA